MKEFMKVMKDSKVITDFLDIHVRVKSRRQYEYHLRLFFEWKNITNIDQYIKDPRLMDVREKLKYEDDIKNDILGYWKYMNEVSPRFHGKTPYVFISAIRRLLETYNIIFTPEFYRQLRQNGNGNFSITDYQTPTKQQLKEILSNADCESRALFLMQMTSGQRIEQIINLCWGDVQLEHEYPRIFIRQQKGRRAINTRITPEAKEYLMQYKEQYERFIKIRESRTPVTTRKPLDRNRIFPMSEANAIDMWNNLIGKVKLDIHDPVSKKPLYGTHSLRRYFFSHFGNENDALFFMGKKPENITSYKDKSAEQLDVLYLKGAENLVIFKEKSELPDFLNEYDDKMEKMNDKLETSNERIEIYKDRLKVQEDQLKTQDERLRTLEFINKELKAPLDFVDSSADTLMILFEYWLNDFKKGSMEFWTPEREKQIINAIDLLKDKLPEYKKKSH